MSALPAEKDSTRFADPMAVCWVSFFSTLPMAKVVELITGHPPIRD